MGIDGGYVRGRSQDWFEVIAGKSVVSFHRDSRVPDSSGRCFAFVQTMDEMPRARLVDALRQQGMQPRQQVIFLSDGADTLQRLQQNIAPEAEHVLDWFHLSMRLTVLRQMVKGAWTDAATVEAKTAALDRIKWLLWHGNAPDAVDDIEYLADDVAGESGESPTSTALRKRAAALGSLPTSPTTSATSSITASGSVPANASQPALWSLQSTRSSTRAWISASRCAGRRAVPTYCSRPEPAFSTATSINSSGVAIPPSDRPQPTTMPPLCDGLRR